MTRVAATAAVLAASLVLAAAAHAQAPAPAAAPKTAVVPAPAKAKDSLSIFFDSGSFGLRADALPVLDQAARLYRAGQPIVMILTATTDPTGSPIANLGLSQQRADAVLRGLVARGIPAERFQLLAKGETELPVAAKAGQAEPLDRQVEIAWR